MSYWIMKINGEVISGTTDQFVTRLESQTSENKEVFRLYDTAISKKFNE